MLRLPQALALDFPYICLHFFPGNFSRQEEEIITDKSMKN